MTLCIILSCHSPGEERTKSGKEMMGERGREEREREKEGGGEIRGGERKKLDSALFINSTGNSRPSSGVHGKGSQVGRGLQGIRQSQTVCQGARGATPVCPSSSPQCSDQADEEPRLWQGLQVQSSIH